MVASGTQPWLAGWNALISDPQAQSTYTPAANANMGLRRQRASADFERFKGMMLSYLYPVCHDFLARHNGTCDTHYWANWDLCNMSAILSIGALCEVAWNQGVDLYAHAGNRLLAGAEYVARSNLSLPVSPTRSRQWLPNWSSSMVMSQAR